MANKQLSGSLTIRVPVRSLRILRERAEEAGKTPSEFVRGLLERELEAPPDGAGPTMMERTARWVGAVSSRGIPAGRDVRQELEDWNPDRRG